MLNPTGRVILVSGATRGIGRVVTERLLAAGCLVCAGVRDPGRLPEHPNLTPVRYDATKPGDAATWVAGAIAAYGRIDSVVNAAGINDRGTLLEGPDTPFGACWSVNAMAPMLVVRAAWPYLVASGTGRVVTVSSLSGKRVRNDNLSYAMSKFAVMALTQEVRRLGWQHGIRASSMCPGLVDTEMTAHVTKLARDKMSRPEDIAGLVEILLLLPNTANIAELLVNCQFDDV